jgi:hypothetical protein
MPSKSKAQHNFMAAVAHNPAFAKKVGVPQSVGKEFNEADKGRKFSKGGDMKKMNMGGYAGGGMPMVMKDGKKVPAFAADGVGKMAKGGMAKGGMKHEDVKMDKKMMQKAVNKHEGRLHKGESMTKLNMGGMAKKMNMGGMAYSKGGYTKAADGVATKGKTKGMQVKMRGGGMC